MNPTVELPLQAVPNRRRAVSGALCAAAVVAIGHALWLSDGSYDRFALIWVTAGIVLAWGGLLVPSGKHLALTACLLGFLWQLHELWNQAPLFAAAAPLAYFTVAFPIFAAAGAGAMLLPRASRNIFIIALLATHFITGVWLLANAPKPWIDVYEVTQDACQAMSRGHDPYAIDFPDIFQGTHWESQFYPPGFVYGGRVHFGYPYMPLSFYVDYLGYLAGGDFRYGNLLAITAAGALLAWARRGALGAAACCLLLLTPKGYYVVERGWAEPVVVLCLAAVVFCAARRPGALPWPVGLLMASKQHMLLASPALLLLLPRPWRCKTAGPFVLKALLLAALATLPLALWNPHAFWRSAVEVQMHNPFRIDSLNFAAAWARAGHGAPAGCVSFILAAAAAVVVIWRAPRSAAGFAAGLAVIYLSFFALSKQTFCNYYFLIIGALCCCIDAVEPLPTAPEALPAAPEALPATEP